MSAATKPTFAAGDTVYNIFGAAGRYVAPCGRRGHAVEPIWEDEDDEPHYSPVETWDEVFVVVPEQRFNERIAELHQEISEHELHLASLRERTEEAERADRAAAQRRQAHPELADLDLWLSGGVTHIVLVSTYCVEIAPAEELLKRRDDGSMRLVSLFGDKDRSYRWSMSRYSDGSGGGDDCLLASSEEDAKRRASEWLNLQFRRGDMAHSRTDLARSAMKYGLPFPDELRAKIEAEDKERAANLLESRRKALAQAQQAFDEVAGAA